MKDRIVRAYIDGEWWKNLIVPNKLTALREIISGHMVEGDVEQLEDGTFRVDFHWPASERTELTNYDFGRKRRSN